MLEAGFTTDNALEEMRRRLADADKVLKNHLGATTPAQQTAQIHENTAAIPLMQEQLTRIEGMLESQGA